MSVYTTSISKSFKSTKGHMSYFGYDCTWLEPIPCIWTLVYKDCFKSIYTATFTSTIDEEYGGSYESKRSNRSSQAN